jgi:hypothetical protein
MLLFQIKFVAICIDLTVFMNWLNPALVVGAVEA